MNYNNLFAKYTIVCLLYNSDKSKPEISHLIKESGIYTLGYLSNTLITDTLEKMISDGWVENYEAKNSQRINQTYFHLTEKGIFKAGYIFVQFRDIFKRFDRFTDDIFSKYEHLYKTAKAAGLELEFFNVIDANRLELLQLVPENCKYRSLNEYDLMTEWSSKYHALEPKAVANIILDLVKTKNSLDELLVIGVTVLDLIGKIQYTENCQEINRLREEIIIFTDPVEKHKVVEEFYCNMKKAAELINKYYDGKTEYIITANRMLSWLALSKTQDDFDVFLKESQYQYCYENDYIGTAIPFLKEIRKQSAIAERAVTLFEKDESDITYIRMAVLAILDHFKAKAEPFDINIIEL